MCLGGADPDSLSIGFFKICSCVILNSEIFRLKSPMKLTSSALCFSDLINFYSNSLLLSFITNPCFIGDGTSNFPKLTLLDSDLSLPVRSTASALASKVIYYRDFLFLKKFSVCWSFLKLGCSLSESSLSIVRFNLSRTALLFSMSFRGRWNAQLVGRFFKFPCSTCFRALM